VARVSAWVAGWARRRRVRRRWGMEVGPVERVDLRGCGRAKTVGKIIGIPFSFFFIFLVILYYLINMVINMKIGYGVTGIDRNMIGFSYRLFLDWTEKFDNLSDLLYYLSGLSRTVYLGWFCYLF
jgi:hypothetical protein